MTDFPTIHASAVLVGAKAALIRGPAGAGKSQLVWDVLQAAARGALPFARLVGDDRVQLGTQAGRLLVRTVPALAGMLEIRGLGIRQLPYEALAAVGLVIDLAAADAARLPGLEAEKAVICEVSLPRLTVAAGVPPLPLLAAFLGTAPARI